MTSNDPRPEAPRPQPSHGDAQPADPNGDAVFGRDAEPTYVPEQPPAGAPLHGDAVYGYPGYQSTAPQPPVHGYPAYGPPAYAQQYGSGYGQQYAAASYYGSEAGQYPGQVQYPNQGQYPGLGQYPGYGLPVPPAKPSVGRRLLIGVGSAALAVGLVLSGMAIAHSQNSDNTASQAPPGISNGAGNGSRNGDGSGSGNTGVFPGGVGNSPRGSGAGGNGTSASASVATKAQQTGIVTVVSVLSYQGAESAGTGMIVSSNGEILTNNHVINGATSITVTVQSTGKSYRADVVGTAPTKDVAVLKLRNASGLTTAKLGDSSDVQDLDVGDSVIGVGNAGGTGTLRASAGKVTALNKSITATDESGQDSEKLAGLIEINAGVVAGDSGGPLYDSHGDIVGMDTAASASSTGQTASTAYAIPIDNALKLAQQIHSGAASSVIHIGLPAFLGITVQPTTSGGALVYQIIDGDPADKAGMTAGSRITAVDGKTVTNSTTLKTVLSGYKPGQSVSVTWTDSGGQSHTANVNLTQGPAD